MKIKMLKSIQAAPDGFSIATYNEGETYDLPQSLAEVFIHEHWAESKNVGAAKENKKQKDSY